jgi:hypothetical protein
MGFWDQVRTFFALGSIVTLILVGFLVAIGSGDVDVSRRQGVRRFLPNLWWIVVRVLGYLAGFIVVQQIIGIPLRLGW